jgi:hypothetical protein
MPPSPLRTRAFRALGLVCCTIVGLQGCGRSELTDYYFDDELPGAGAPAAGGASNNGAVSNSGGKKPGTAGTSSTTGGSSAVGGSVGLGGTAAIGGVSAGGAATAGSAQGGFAQAGSGAIGGSAPVGAITCGGQTCKAASQTCCATLGGFGCIPRDQDCSGATLVCGSSSDCGDGLVCCLQVIGEADATSECKSECTNGPGRERRLCTTDDECGPNRPFCRDTALGVRVCTRF